MLATEATTPLDGRGRARAGSTTIAGSSAAGTARCPTGRPVSPAPARGPVGTVERPGADGSGPPLPHGSRPHPQHRHHRPHRPRQVDAGRPPPGAHQRGRPPRHAGPVPRLDGPRARAGHHDQAAVGPPRLRPPRHPPHRHARPCRLRLRGLPLARRLRGRHPAGRRGPGHPGPDPRQLLPGARERPRDRARRSTRSTCPPPSRSAPPPRSSRSWACPPARSCGSAPRPARASRSCSRRSSSGCPRRRATPRPRCRR